MSPIKTSMTDFAQYDGYKKDFDFYVGSARPKGFQSREFGDRLWADVSRLLETPFDGGTITPDDHDGYNYWFDNDDLSASLLGSTGIGLRSAEPGARNAHRDLAVRGRRES
ncbi:hypothetical protein RKD26_000004 [Streptomyces calvus]|uniref:hypothetical protein n=1 Tax=Streptomyces calvus TaxID=67282 RepID=UPI003513160E